MLVSSEGRHRERPVCSAMVHLQRLETEPTLQHCLNGQSHTGRVQLGYHCEGRGSSAGLRITKRRESGEFVKVPHWWMALSPAWESAAE